MGGVPDGVPGAAVLRAAVVEAPLDVSEHAALVERAAAGAVVTFAGVVRDHDGGRAVRGLEYSAHPTAEQVVSGWPPTWPGARGACGRSR